MAPKPTTLPIAQLETCDRVRVRKVRPKPDSELVLEYAEAYEAGLLLEPLDVFQEKDTKRYVVADGEHRLLAAQRAKIAKVPVRLHEGDEIDAIEFAMRCNQAHGLRLTKADRYHQFCRLMEIQRLKSKYRTDSDLSEQLGVTIRTIHKYKAEWRNSEGGSALVRAAKSQLNGSAAKHPGRPPKEPESALDMKPSYPQTRAVEPNPETSARKAIEPRGTRPQPKPQPQPLTTEQRRVAKEVRGSTKRHQGDWTSADEHALNALKREWARATGPARKRFLAEVAP
jgi:hypothetical protein